MPQISNLATYTMRKHILPYVVLPNNYLKKKLLKFWKPQQTFALHWSPKCAVFIWLKLTIVILDKSLLKVDFSKSNSLLQLRKALTSSVLQNLQSNSFATPSLLRCAFSLQWPESMVFLFKLMHSVAVFRLWICRELQLVSASPSSPNILIFSFLLHFFCS